MKKFNNGKIQKMQKIIHVVEMEIGTKPENFHNDGKSGHIGKEHLMVNLQMRGDMNIFDL